MVAIVTPIVQQKETSDASKHLRHIGSNSEVVMLLSGNSISVSEAIEHTSTKFECAARCAIDLRAEISTNGFNQIGLEPILAHDSTRDASGRLRP
jgi:hypothetical protein